MKCWIRSRFFDRKYYFSVIGFSGIFGFGYSTYNIYERPAVSVIPNYVKESLANSRNSRMCAKGLPPSFASFGCSEEPWSCKLLRAYSRVVSSLLKSYASNQAISKKDAAMLCYVHEPNLTLHPWADKLITKSCKVANPYEEGLSIMPFLNVLMRPSGTAYKTTEKYINHRTWRTLRFGQNGSSPIKMVLKKSVHQLSEHQLIALYTHKL